MKLFKAISVLALALAIAGCGSDAGPTRGGQLSDAQRHARVQLVKDNPALNDLQLAYLCPALYPTDLHSDVKKYKLEKQKATPVKWSSAQLALAANGRCGKPIPFPPAAKPAKAASTASTTSTTTQGTTQSK
ncbi:MAG: hypothetical protein NT122_09490 [Solirubrobacterales bacterium]|nr:hypothetical protein [Solirubrobacterales bacterium]